MIALRDGMSWKWNNAVVDSALEAMPEEFGLKKLLIANKAEVKQMCITEYNEAETTKHSGA